MKVHSIEKIQEIKRLRQLGYSINAIVKALNVPKTTVWHHVKNINIPADLKIVLKSKQGGSTERSRQDWVKAEILAGKILLGPHAKLALAAAMLYWGEGGKKACEITNTDFRLIQLYLKFLYEAAGLPQDRLKFIVRTFTGMDEQACLLYWSHHLNIDPQIIVHRHNDGGTSGRAEFGMCRVLVKKGGRALKLMHSLIRIAFSDMMGFEKPVPQWINYRRSADIRKPSPHSLMDSEQSRPKG